MHQLLLLALWLLPIAQSNTCPALVDAAYAAAALECAAVEPGTTCYANAPLEIAALAEGDFTRPGDRISGLQTIESGAMQIDEGEWGLSITTFTANHPEQLMTMVILGDVELENASTESQTVTTVPVQVTFPSGANLRATPDTAAELVAPLVVGQVIPATGKLADGSWFRLYLDDERSGWVRADLIDVDGDFALLPDVTPDDEPPATLFSPLQAFNFTSGMDDSPCNHAPDSGVLLQTNQPVNLRVNGVDLQFDGTIFLQAQQTMTVHVLENTAQVTSGGATEITDAGNRIRIRYDTESAMLTTPRIPEPYVYVRMRPLPFRLLPREIPDLAFNLLNVVTPAAPDQPLLNGITAEDSCTVAAVNEVRLRQGPGRDFPIQGALFAGEHANPDGRAQGLDNILWWRVTEGVWVRSDVVLAAGMCGELPLVGIPPLIGELESEE